MIWWQFLFWLGENVSDASKDSTEVEGGPEHSGNANYLQWNWHEVGLLSFQMFLFLWLYFWSFYKLLNSSNITKMILAEEQAPTSFLHSLWFSANVLIQPCCNMLNIEQMRMCAVTLASFCQCDKYLQALHQAVETSTHPSSSQET